MAQHHPSSDIVAEYACGSATPGMSLLIAAQTTGEPSIRERARVIEGIGGMLLATEDAAEMSVDALDRTLEALDAPLAEMAANDRTGPIPAVVLDQIGMSYDDIPWRFMLPGVSGYDFEGFEGEHVSLLRAKPGAKVPKHTHAGTEATLVLQGALSDDGIVYSKGDVAINDESDDHRPEIVGDEICICLIVREGDLKFTGRLSRILNVIGG